MTSVDRSTYRKLINDVIGDVPEKAEIENIAPEGYQNWILRAQQEICKRLKIYEQYALTFTLNVIDYPLQDRPIVTAATNATPIAVTSASHGLANLDRINMRDIEGNTNANGAMQLSAVATNSFSLNKYADVESASNATPINIASTNHPFSTGDIITITGILGNTAANVTNNAITVVDPDNFTLDAVAGNGDYISGGIALKQVAGSGAYTYGGQYWKTSELPTYVKNVVGVRRTWGNIYRPVKMVGEVDLLNDQIFESTFGLSRSGYSVPIEASFITINGLRYFHLFARPLATENVVLICQIEVVPDRFSTFDVASQVILRSTYDEATKSYVKSKMYERIGDINKMMLHQNAFEQHIKLQKTNSVGSTRIAITYR